MSVENPIIRGYDVGREEGRAEEKARIVELLQAVRENSSYQAERYALGEAIAEIEKEA